MEGVRLSIHFFSNEFACKCKRRECDAPPVSMDLVHRLEDLRAALGRGLIILSGCRCGPWNAHVGGVKNSQHMLGRAADIKTAGRTESIALAALAKSVGFKGIGIYEKFVHVDVRQAKFAQWEVSQ